MTRAWPTGEREAVIARIDAHRAADEIVQGEGWDGRRGCAIGCSLDTYSHAEYCRVVLGESDHNLELAQLIGHLHDSLPLETALDWPGHVARALQPGADTTLALKRWLLWLLEVELRDFPAAQPMAVLFRRSLDGDEPSRYEWTRGAWAASDARAASDAWAAWAAWDARAAWAARAAWDARGARGASYERQADALIEVFESLPEAP